MKSFIVNFLFTWVIVGFCSQAKAQDILYGPSVSYQYQKGSIVKTGGYFAFAFHGENMLKTDVTANFTWTQNKFAVIPEIALSFYPETSVVAPFLRGEVTPYTLTPKVGVSVATLIDLDVGYGFSIANKKDYLPMKGFAASLRFNIPLNFKLNM